MRNPVILAALAATPILASPLSSTPSDKEPRRVQVKTQDDLTLAGDFYASGRKGTAPAALLVHDAGADRSQLTKVAERLQRTGFAVLAIDLRGHGESKGENLDWSGLTESERAATWTFATRDLEAGADWLRKQEGIHRTNLSLVGAGSGCALAVRHASRDENVRCVTLLAPRSENFGFDVASDIHEIEGLPTLVVAGRELQVHRPRVQLQRGRGRGRRPQDAVQGRELDQGLRRPQEGTLARRLFPPGRPTGKILRAYRERSVRAPTQAVRIRAAVSGEG